MQLLPTNFLNFSSHGDVCPHVSKLMKEQMSEGKNCFSELPRSRGQHWGVGPLPFHLPWVRNGSYHRAFSEELSQTGFGAIFTHSNPETHTLVPSTNEISYSHAFSVQFFCFRQHALFSVRHQAPKWPVSRKTTTMPSFPEASLPFSPPLGGSVGNKVQRSQPSSNFTEYLDYELICQQINPIPKMNP